jgi:hypothetical protein
MSDQVTDNTVQQPVQPPAQEPVAQLQLQDIVTAAQAIQLGAQRGAYRAEEFTKVGSSYERIVAFLQASGALAVPEQPASDSADQAPAAN